MGIKGITITLYQKEEVGRDRFNYPIYEESPVNVENVLVSPVSSDDIVDATQLKGKKAVYTLAIPKEDDHSWEDCTVEFFNQKWRTFGFSLEGIKENIPLKWNKKIMVERYE